MVEPATERPGAIDDECRGKQRRRLARAAAAF